MRFFQSAVDNELIEHRSVEPDVRDFGIIVVNDKVKVAPSRASGLVSVDRRSIDLAQRPPTGSDTDIVKPVDDVPLVNVVVRAEHRVGA
jgi:hypothetical protein